MISVPDDELSARQIEVVHAYYNKAIVYEKQIAIKYIYGST